MAGGDMRVQNQSIGGIGSRNQLETLDAHSKKAGTFTEARSIGGQQVWMTPQGAEAHDRLVAEGYDMRASEDPGMIKRWLLGSIEGNKGEQHLGKTK